MSTDGFPIGESFGESLGESHEEPNEEPDDKSQRQPFGSFSNSNGIPYAFPFGISRNYMF